MSLFSESIFWETGAWPRQAPTDTQIRSATGIVDRIVARVRRWVRTTTAAPFVFVPPPPQEKLEDKILAPLKQEQAAAFLENIGVDGGSDYVETVTAARMLCSRAWPRYVSDETIPTTAPLSPDDLAEVWSVTQVMISPDRVLDELDSWTITREQAEAFRVVLPAMSEVIDDALGAAVVDLVFRKKSLTWQQEDVLRIWKGAPPDTPIITSPPSGSVQPPPPTAPTLSKSPIDTTQEQAAARRRQR